MQSIQFNARLRSARVLPMLMVLSLHSIAIASDQEDPRRKGQTPASRPAEAERIIQVVRIQYAEPTAVAAAIGQIMHTRKPPAPHRAITIMPEPRTRSLVIGAHAEALETILDLVAKLDVEPVAETATQVRVYALEHAVSEDVVDIMANLYSNPNAIAFRADPRTNAVIVSAPEPAFERIEDILRKLDQPVRQCEKLMKVFPLTHIDPESAGNVLDRVFDDEDWEFGVDEHSSALVVSAPPSLMTRMEGLLQVLDVAGREPESRSPPTHVFEFRHATPDDHTAELLELLLGDQGEFAFDRRHKLVLIKASQDLFDEAAGVLEMLDSPPAAVDPGPPPRSLHLRLAWLVSGHENLQPVPGDMAPGLEKLEQIGVDDLQLAAQTVVTTNGSQFNIKASPILEHRCDLTIEGKLVEGRDSVPRVDLNLSVIEYSPHEVMVQDRPDSVRRFNTRDLCSLRTSVAAPVGHPVVIGVTPIDRMTSVFVLQVLESEQKGVSRGRFNE